MRRETADQKEVINLAAYRFKRKASRQPREVHAPPAEIDPEEALNLVARYLLMAVQVITDRET